MVFVAGDRAYKVKKPVVLGFLDYDTLARRHAACREEVRVNRELAPEVYLGVRTIVRTARGFRVTREDAPGAVEYAVQMRSFGEQDTLAGMSAAGALTRAEIAATAHRLADFHRCAAVVEDWGPDQVLATWRANVEELRQTDHPEDWHLEVLTDFAEAFVQWHAPELRRRLRQGLARDGHGDLRCEHVLTGPKIRVVDRIEFDPRLRRTDVARDLAFLAMDLEAREQRWAARELFNAYRHAGMSPGGEALRSFYAAHCALVRVKVALIATGTERLEEAMRLWALSERLCWRARAPLALVICGPAASGKSVLAGALARRTEIPVVSSDVVRKRLAQRAPEEPARAEHYSASFTRRTYEQLARDALLALRESDAVIVDATCRVRADRALLLDRLRRVGMARVVVRCAAPLELSLERARRRLRDPSRVSDATPEIAQAQFHSFEEFAELPADELLELDTTESLDVQLAAIASALDRRAHATRALTTEHA